MSSSEDKKTADGKDKLRLAGPSPVPTPPPGLIGGSKPNENNKDAKGADGKSSSVAPGAFSVCDPAPSRGEAPAKGTKNEPEGSAVQIDESDHKGTKKSDEKSKTLLRLAPATAPEGAAVDEIVASNGRAKASEEGKSKNLLRLAPATASSEGAPVDESAAASSGGRTNERGDDDLNNLLRHRVQPATVSDEALGDDINVSPSPNDNDDAGDGALDAEIAEDVDVEALLDERLQQMVAATVPVQRENGEEEEDDDKSHSTSHERRRTLPLIIFAGVVIIVGGVFAVLALLPQSSKSNGATIQLTSNTESPTPAPNTPNPTAAPTRSRSEKVRAILADYAPLDGKALAWLTDTDTWEPDDKDRNSDYLWLERYVMAEVYFTTNGPNWKRNYNWLSAKPCCLWYPTHSVTSNECPGPLTMLDLHNNQLTSSIPSSIGNLSNLEILYMAGNFLTSSIPSSIGTLSQLTYMSLSRNRLTSTIPSSIGSLTKLEYLMLYDNNLSGSVPDFPSTAFKFRGCQMQFNCIQNTSSAQTSGCEVAPSNCS